MIDFACKRFQLDEVIKCGLSLTKAEYLLFEYVVKHADECTTEQLAAHVSLDLTTVQRAVKKLHEEGVLQRSQQNLEGGGYVYMYSIKSKQELRRILMDIINRWVKTVDTALQKW
jgi:predicted transcriptional regulator